jgi:cbb3-type cytochrome oxidase maturation protein
MYYPYFIAYMTIGFTISLLVFFWALRRGQFKDQDRARFLPLSREEERAAVKRSRASRIEVAALIFLACAGLSASAAVVVLALLRVD